MTIHDQPGTRWGTLYLKNLDKKTGLDIYEIAPLSKRSLGYIYWSNMNNSLSGLKSIFISVHR